MFEGLLEAMPDALVGVDEAGVIQYVNHRTESLFGYDRDDLVGARVEMLVPESLRKVHKVHREGYHEAPSTRPMGTDLKLNGRRRDGTQFPADIALSPIDTGNSILVIAAVHDMTPYRRAEAERRRLDRLLAIVEYSDDAIIGTALDGTVTSWNPAAEVTFGYSSGEIIGESVERLSLQDQLNEARDMLARITTGEQIDHFESVRVRKDGAPITVSLSVSPIREADGSIVGVSTIARDVTQARGRSRLPGP
jgi:PAS domain S-box-containing protein